MMAKLQEIELDNFEEFQVISECVNNLDFNFQDITLGVSEGKEFNFGTFMLLRENGDCVTQWDYTATL